MRDDDLRAELQFHIDMRTRRHMNAGMPPEEAEALARKQFGDMEAAMRGMRMARLRSPKVVLALASLSLAAMWLLTMLAPIGSVVLPPLPAVPRQATTIQKRPPPPPPGPTWAEFVTKVNTFEGVAPKRAR